MQNARIHLAWCGRNYSRAGAVWVAWLVRRGVGPVCGAMVENNYGCWVLASRDFSSCQHY